MTTSEHSNDHKTLDAALESAFASGVAFGAGYPAVEAIPGGFSRKAYLRWRDRWTGLPHEGPTRPPRDAVARQASTYAAMAEQTLHYTGNGGI